MADRNPLYRVYSVYSIPELDVYKGIHYKGSNGMARRQSASIVYSIRYEQYR